MEEKEPPWRAELEESIHHYFEEIGGGSIWYLTGRLMEALAPHIQAAEQRGRAAGAREIADHLESIDPIEFALGSVDAVAEACRMAAEAERKAES